MPKLKFDNSLKPAPITSANQTELEELGKEYAKYFNEYHFYNKSKGNTNNILKQLDRISTRVTELVGDKKRYDVLKKYVTNFEGK
jgi:ethanolamine utilization cobalamin adenosyltransferase